MAGKTIGIVLLGQPNSGKSTLFNGLTGGHQRVGNRPGKTVEKKVGTCERDGVTYTVCDLPGTYSLSAMSDEERITQDYIEAGEAGVVVIMVDSSQLTRSMYMLADYAGGRVPYVLVLNMIDIAENQGKTVDAAKLSSRLGIPVVPFVANDTARYGDLTAAISRAVDENTCVPSDELAKLYAQYSPEWSAAYEHLVAEDDGSGSFDAVWRAAHEASADKQGAVNCGSARLVWVDQIVAGVQGMRADKAPAFLTRLDNALMSARWGKLVGILVCLGALLASMIIGAPLMMLGQIPALISAPLASAFATLGPPAFFIDFIASGLMTVCYFTLSMGGFVFGVALVFGMGWKLFMAFLAGILAKEAVLGALAALFGSASGSLFAAVSGAAAAGFSPAVIATQVSGPEALAFLAALMFNIPCVMVVGATHSETHSLKWTVLISIFYLALALAIGFVVFHVASLVM